MHGRLRPILMTLYLISFARFHYSIPQRNCVTRSLARIVYVCVYASLLLIRFDLPQSTGVLLFDEVFDLSNIFLIFYNILDVRMYSILNKEQRNG